MVKRLQKILDFYGLSATAFSDAIDFNRSTISHLLSGRNKPSLEFIMKVLQKFPEVELYWLLNGKGTFPSTLKPDEKRIVAPEEPSAEIPKIDLPIHEIHSIAKDTSKNESIERIIIFFKDGSFKSYE
ncbi:MAG: helix-turn-helix transcriptional regulator [Flavobacteriaceae bacterium]